MLIVDRETVRKRLAASVPPVVSEDWPNIPVDWARGHLLGSDGREVVDMMSGFAVTNVGHNHPDVIEAARRQMEAVVHAPAGVMASEAQLLLAETLVDLLPGDLDMVWFGNSGAEAVDAALKVARMATGRFRFISFYGSFHGRTVGATSVTGSKAGHRRGYGPLLPGVSFLPYPNCFRCPWGEAEGDCSLECLSALREHMDRVAPPDEVAGVIVEPVQGEGGFIPAPRGFLAGLRKVCDEHGILLIFDEIQTGFGRTGRNFAAETFGVYPDLMCLAKALASGFPISVLAGSSGVLGDWPVGSHGTTFGGNSVSAAAAIATLRVLAGEDLAGRARRLGAALLDRLDGWPRRFSRVGDVRGLGLMVGIEYVDPVSGDPDGDLVSSLLESALERGFLFVAAGQSGQVLRLTPPLNIPEEVLESAVDLLEELTESRE